MSITYNLNIPDPPNIPVQDVTLMQQNTNAIDDWTNVDHYKFSSTSPAAGEHKQVTFGDENVPGAVTNPSSVLYTDVGSASTHAQLFYKNTDIAVLLSSVKCFGNFDFLTGTLSNSYNVTSVGKVLGVFTVTLPAGVLKSTNAAVFVYTSPTSSSVSSSYSLSSVTSLVITVGGLPSLINFAILQY